jgi:hypothetical protein
LISPPNRVLIWEAQLTANDFPPVCAMTGAPAEMWRKFTFSKAPPWAFWVGGVILSAALAERFSGYLPLTRASARRIVLVRVAFVGLILLGFASWAIGVPVAANSSGGFYALLFLLGLGAIFAGVIGILLGQSAMGPAGKLLDRQAGQYQRLIELRNVHPVFVAAVQHLQQMRAQHVYPAPVPPTGNWQ